MRCSKLWERLERTVSNMRALDILDQHGRVDRPSRAEMNVSRPGHIFWTFPNDIHIHTRRWWVWDQHVVEKGRLAKTFKNIGVASAALCSFAPLCWSPLPSDTKILRYEKSWLNIIKLHLSSISSEKSAHRVIVLLPSCCSTSSFGSPAFLMKVLILGKASSSLACMMKERHTRKQCQGVGNLQKYKLMKWNPWTSHRQTI